MGKMGGKKFSWIGNYILKRNICGIERKIKKNEINKAFVPTVVVCH